MPSYPAKPYVVPHDDWFNNNSNNFENNSRTNDSKNITTIHEFFYSQSEVKVGGSDNHIETNIEKKSSKKIIISSLLNSDESFLSKSEEKYSISKIPTELKSRTKIAFQGKKFYKNLPNKNIFKFGSYLSYLKSVFYNKISQKKFFKI